MRPDIRLLVFAIMGLALAFTGCNTGGFDNGPKPSYPVPVPPPPPTPDSDGGYSQTDVFFRKIIDNPIKVLRVNSAKNGIEAYATNIPQAVGAIGFVNQSLGTCPEREVARGWCTGGNFSDSEASGGFTQIQFLRVDEDRQVFFVQDQFGEQTFQLETGELLSN